MVKVLYIESELKHADLDLSKAEISKLPKKLFLAYSIQYKREAGKMKKQLEENKIKVTKMQQVLGCSKIIAKEPVLFIGSGNFHALNLFLQSPALYLIANNKINQVSKEEIEKLKAKRRAAFMKYLNAEKIGILVSAKPGQENLDKALQLKQKLIKKGKSAYIFLSNNIDTSQFESFNINSWVNTACPGLSYDSPNIINLSEINWA